jgi:hypothetical protein
VTAEFFASQMQRLAGLRFMPADLETHWEALQRLPDDALAAAVGRAMVAQSDFPTPHELLTYADLTRPTIASQTDEGDRRAALAEPIAVAVPQTDRTLVIRETWRYDCPDCSDSGQRSIWCGDGEGKPWYGRGFCGRRNEHTPHEWVSTCVCVDSNPTILRRKAARAAKYTQEPAHAKAR